MFDLIPIESVEDQRLNNLLNARMLEVYHRKFRMRLYLVLYVVQIAVIFSTLAVLLPLTGKAPQSLGWILCVPCLCLVFDVNGRIYERYQHHVKFSHIYEDFVKTFEENLPILAYEIRYSQTRYLDGALNESVLEESKSEVLKQLDVYRGKLPTL